ncbi:lysozyme [Bacteroides thetaiotaomicron]|uniref:lysozyme n=1 Tax=Bacteroides thetaiotaomicron TaxID=818 RepID=UPI0039C3A391
MPKLFIASFLFFLLNIKASTGPPQPQPVFIRTDLFEEAVQLIKQYEGWHDNHYPYIGYGHRIVSGEKFGSDITEELADSLLRNDLRQKCATFRRFGKDSLILGVLSYNVGEYRLLGHGQKPKSTLIRKLEEGNRNVESEYLSYRKYKGKVLRSLEKRRKAEFDLLFNKTKLKIKSND